MKGDVLIGNKEKLENLTKKIEADGPDVFQVISDFDGTLTQAYLDGQKVPSIISVLRDGNYLTPDYSAKAHELFNAYYPIEKDHSIPDDVKKIKMHEWWFKHFDLLIKSGLRQDDLRRVAKSGKIKFRNGVGELVNYLCGLGIPLVIISSSGLGTDSINMFFEENGLLRDNIHIISNNYQWDDTGRAVAVAEPIIHALNKDETVLKNYHLYDDIKHRTNALVLGDNPGDVNMLGGSNVDCALKIGFLNEPGAETKYGSVFDIVLTNDPGVEYVNGLLKKMFE